MTTFSRFVPWLNRFALLATPALAKRTFKVKNEALMISRRFRAFVPTLVLALTCVAAIAGPAFAGSAYDGDWSVLLVANSGACGPTYRYGAQIANGKVIYDGGGTITMQGRVTPKGAVRVVVRSGDQWAEGSGRLTNIGGGGVWRGQGMSGSCAGTWAAERRG